MKASTVHSVLLYAGFLENQMEALVSINQYSAKVFLAPEAHNSLLRHEQLACLMLRKGRALS